VSYLPLKSDNYGLTRPTITDKIRVHQQLSSDSEIYDFIKSHALKKKDVKGGWRDTVSKAFRNVRELWEFDRLINIVLTFENRTYGFDKSDQRFIKSLKRRRPRR